MRKTVFWGGVSLIILALVGGMGKTCRAQEPDQTVCLAERCFAVEVAATPDARAHGLMARDRLDADRGMLFVFEEQGEYPFWMKNTLIPLDMVWIGADRRVVHVEEGVPPCVADPCPVYAPGAAALYVLELPAGTAAALGPLLGREVRM